jgi:hypothetical protein
MLVKRKWAATIRNCQWLQVSAPASSIGHTNERGKVGTETPFQARFQLDVSPIPNLSLSASYGMPLVLDKMLLCVHFVHADVWVADGE